MVYSRQQIEEIIPHRQPFLLIDEIWELYPGKRVVGAKNIREDEFYFKGHFPNYPVMPGVLIIEALAQAGAAAILSEEKNRGCLVLFAGINKLRFRKQVVPPNQLKLEVEIIKMKGAIGKGKGTAYLGDEIAAEGELLFAVSKQHGA